MLSLVYLSCEIATQIHDSFLKAHVGQKFWEDTAETHKISLGISERSVKALEVFWENMSLLLLSLLFTHI